MTEISCGGYFCLARQKTAGMPEAFQGLLTKSGENRPANNDSYLRGLTLEYFPETLGCEKEYKGKEFFIPTQKEVVHVPSGSLSSFKVIDRFDSVYYLACRSDKRDNVIYRFIRHRGFVQCV